MNTVAIVLLILLAIYVPIYIYVRTNKAIQEKGLVPYGPLIMIKTKWGLKLMDDLGKYHKFWNFFGIFSIIVSILLMSIIIGILILDLTMLPKALNSQGLGVEYALAIPGLNPMLPLVYGIIGLVFAMVIHEMAHGIQSRTNNVKVNSSGLLYGVVPLGAFVEPDEEETEKASRKAKSHIFAAGITINFIAAVVSFILMTSLIGGCLTSTYDNNAAVYAVTEDSDNTLPAGAIILSIDGVDCDLDSFYKELEKNNSGTVKSYTIKYNYKNEIKEINNLPLGVYVERIVSDSPASGVPGLEKGKYLVYGKKATDSENTYFNIPENFTKFMQKTSPGEEITLGFASAGDALASEEKVTLAKSDNGSVGFLGVSTTLSKMSLITPEKMMKTGTDPFYGCESITECAVGALSYISAPFQGFSPVPESVHWWYEPNFGGDFFWILIQVIYWIFWLNIVLAISNALPALPFDGGLLFVAGVDYLYERFGVTDKEERNKRVNTVSSIVTYATLFILILVMFAIIF